MSLEMLLRQQNNETNKRLRLMETGVSFDFLGLQHSRNIRGLVDSNYEMLSNHDMSYDKWRRLYHQYELPVVEDPSAQFTSLRFYELRGFWPEQLHEIC